MNASPSVTSRAEPTRHAPWRARAVGLVCILLAGAALTWTAAWATAWRARHDARPARTQMATATNRVGIDTILDSVAVNPRSWPWLGGWQWWRRYNTEAYNEFLSRSPNHPAGPPPAWTFPAPRGTQWVDTVGFGWPMIALRTRTSRDAAKDPLAVNLGATQMPVRPAWPGFVGNTLIYALVLGGSWLACTRVRTALRARRGACPVCGYDRAGLANTTTCPECGHTP